MRRIRLISILYAVALTAPSAGHALAPVTHCGGTWAGDVFLAADLDCSNTKGAGIGLTKGAHLDLAGFTLVGGEGHGVLCYEGCTVDGGGGAINGAGLSGVTATSGLLAISDVTVSGNGRSGIAGHDRARVVANGVTATGNGADGIYGRTLLASGCTTTANVGVGLNGDRRLTVDSSTSSGNQLGLRSEGAIRVSNTAVTGNAFMAAWGRKVIVDDSTITDNSRGGAFGEKTLRATASAFSGNDVDSVYCVAHALLCSDLVSRRQPKLDAVTCESSAQWEYEGMPSRNFGVCAGD